MSDSDWQDPFADDEAARERAARRAERERRRREREQQARESLGERVRGELGEGEAGAGSPPPAAGPDRREEPPPAPASPPPAEPQQEPAERITADRPASPPPRPPRSSGEIVRRRRIAALVGIGALIVAVAGAGAVVSRMGDDPPPAPPPEPRKTVEVTIPEGYDRAQIAKVAKEAGLRGNYVKATAGTDGINAKALGARDADSLEGFLFPATYEVFRKDKVDSLVAKQLDAFEQNLSGLDLRYAKRKGLSAFDVVTIASLIEREIQVPEERKLAASVIYNRLDAGNPLGIDATIRFEDSNWTEPLLESRLGTDTPYNTHVNAGLPPGPIGNPGLASLEAAAKPANTDYFFYVIKPGTCNEHEFVETQAEFDAAVAEYHAARDAAGGKSPTDCG